MRATISTFLPPLRCTPLAALSVCFALHAQDQCPTTVRFDATLTNISGYGIEGKVVYQDGTKEMFASSIAHFSPTLIPGMTGYVRPTISPDGEWVIAVCNGDIKAAKLDGTMTRSLGARTKNSGIGFYYNSPKQEPDKLRYEFAYIDENDPKRIWAQIVDFSGSEPVAGAKRMIADAMAKAADYEEMSAGGEHFILDSREIQKGAAVVGTIPDAGNGTATGWCWWDVTTQYNCAASLSWDGTLWSTNVYDPTCTTNGGCIPGYAGHNGFLIRRTRHPDEAKVDKCQSLHAQTYGVESVIWVPDSVEGHFTRAQHDWYAGPWANDPSYLAVSAVAKAAGSTAGGIYLLNWKTNVWSRITPAGQAAGWPAVWLAGVTATAGRSLANHRATQPNLHMGAGSIQTTVDPLGRALGRSSPASSLPMGIYLTRSIHGTLHRTIACP